MNYLVPVAFVAIGGSLCFALYYLMQNGRGGKFKANKMARALAFRVGFSIVLFLSILLAWKLGYIHPTGIQVKA
jgi:Protein of unknown function (DUF2909)